MWPFTVRKNCPSDLKKFANSRPSASNFKSFSWSLEQFFLTVGQYYFGNWIPFLNRRKTVAILMTLFQTWGLPFEKKSLLSWTWTMFIRTIPLHKKDACKTSYLPWWTCLMYRHVIQSMPYRQIDDFSHNNSWGENLEATQKQTECMAWKDWSN